MKKIGLLVLFIGLFFVGSASAIKFDHYLKSADPNAITLYMPATEALFIKTAAGRNVTIAMSLATFDPTAIETAKAALRTATTDYEYAMRVESTCNLMKINIREAQAYGDPNVTAMDETYTDFCLNLKRECFCSCPCK